MLAFHLYRIKVNASQTMSQSIKEWKILSNERRLDYYLKPEDDWIPKDEKLRGCDTFLFLEKIEKSDLFEYIRFMKLEPPIERPYLMYVKSDGMKHLAGPSDIIDYKIWAKEQFARLPLANQYKWFRQYFIAWEKFENSLKSMSKVDKAIYNKVYSGANFPSETKIHKSYKPRNWPVILIPGSKLKYDDQPLPKYPLFPTDLYIAIYSKSNYSKEMLKTKYSSLSWQMKEALFEQVRDFGKEYQESIKKYVDELAELKRQTFLGDYRLDIYRLLSFDPFETAYPCNKYPLYRRLKRSFNNPTEYFLKSKKLINEESVNDSEKYEAEGENLEGTYDDTCGWTKSDVLYSINQSMALLDEITNAMNS